MPWQPLPLSYAVATYPFTPSSAPNELPLQIGDQLYVIEEGGKDGTWCRGYLVQPPSLLAALTGSGRAASDARVFSGIFPKSCIEIREQLGEQDAQTATAASGKPVAPVPMLKIGDESATSNSEPLVDEISSCLREWYVSHLPDLVLRQDYAILDQISEVVIRLDYARRELLNDVLTAQERSSVQSEAVWDLVRGNKSLGAEVIVRDPKQQGRLLTADDSAIEMSKLQSVMSVLDEPPVPKAEVTRLHHLLAEIKSATGPDTETATLTMALYQRNIDGSLSQCSESYISTLSDHPKTLFSDISSRETSSDGQVFLVIKAAVAKAPRTLPVVVNEAPATKNGGFRASRDSLINRRRSNIMFGSKRKSDRPTLNGRSTPQPTATQSPYPTDETPEEKKAPAPPLSRVVGVGLLDMAEILQSDKEEFRDVDLWAAADELAEDEADFPQLLPYLVQSQTKRYRRAQSVQRVHLEFKSFIEGDADALMRMNPMSMHLTPKTQRIGFSEAPAKRRSDIYLTLSKANVFSDSLLSHPEFGAVPPKSTAMYNMQLTMELRDSAGIRFDRCILASSNTPPTTALRTDAVEVGTAWDQTICIRLPMHKVSEAHFVLSVAEAPNFPFALAWMPLWDKNAFIKDGKHTLMLHAYDKSTSTFTENGKGMYLSLPWDHTAFAASGESSSAAQVASIEVETHLVSTEFSQDRVLAALLNWKSLSSAKLIDTLQKLVFVAEIEIVKQLYEVLDSLFAVLEVKSGTSKFEDLIFNDIVFVLGIVHDRRYNLGPRVERYAEEHLEAPPIAPCLVRSLTRLLQSLSDPQSARDMRALFKVGKQFMKLLMVAYSQHDQISSAPYDEVNRKRHQSLKQDMQAVFFGLQMMMRSETPALVGSKTLLIQNFHSWLPELMPVYTKDEVIKIAVDFLDSCEEPVGKLALYKLILVLNYTNLDQIWVEDKDWEDLVRHCQRWISEYIPFSGRITEGWREQVRLCCSVVASLLKRPVPLLLDFLPTLVSTYCKLATWPSTKKWTLSLLFQESYPFVTKNLEYPAQFEEVLLELSALVSEITKLQDTVPMHKSSAKQSAQILQTLSLVRSILSEKACPSSWLSLHIYHHASAIDILTFVSQQLITSFVPEPEEAESFNMELWKAYFDMLLSLVCSESLLLESFSEQKRRAVWKIAGDVRQAGADLLKSSWAALGWDATDDDQRRYHIQKIGGFQVQYVPSLVGPIVQLCLSMHEGLRRVGVHILQTMIISEWALSEDLALVETEVIGALNSLLKLRSASPQLTANEIVARKLFVGELLDSFQTIASQPGDALWSAVEDLVNTIEELIDLLSGGADEVESESRLSPLPVTTNGTDRVPSRAEVPDRSISRLEGRIFGSQALECYKQLAEEYERAGDYKRLAKTHRAIARIHETRAASRMGHMGIDGGLNGDDDLDDEEEEDE